MNGNNPFFSQPQQTVRPVSMVMGETGTYQDQFYRPVSTDIQVNNINQLIEATRGGRVINPTSVSSAMGRMITPSANTEGAVGIANGWGMRRFRFMLRVDEVSPFQTTATTSRIFYGYTDFAETSLQGTLDPRTRIYFNSVVTVNYVDRQTPSGFIRQPVVVDSNQILNGYSEDETMARNPLFTVRPQDVFGTVQLNHVVAPIANINFDNGHAQRAYSSVDGTFSQVNKVIDTRSTFAQSGEQKLARRNDLSPVQYLFRTLDSYEKAVRNSGVEEGLSYRYGLAESNSSSGNIAGNEFLNILREEAQFRQRGYVELNDLYRVFPGFSDVMQVSVGSSAVRRLNTSQDSQVWHGSDMSTLTCSILGMTVPGIMMDNMITNLNFTCRNGIGGPLEFDVIINPDSVRMIIDGLDPTDYVRTFIDRLKVEVLSNISFNNQLPFVFTMQTQIIGESIIELNLNNEGFERFVAPTFADARFSTMLTANEQVKRQVANDLDYVARSVIEDAGMSHMPVMPDDDAGTALPY